MDTSLLGPRDVDMTLDPEILDRVSGLEGCCGQDANDEIMIHYTVTQECPFRCRGCINALTAGHSGSNHAQFVPKEGDDSELDRDVKGIARLIQGSGKPHAVIVFYGGEPMLRLDRMHRLYKELGQTINGAVQIRYMVITSGHFLKDIMAGYPGLASDLALAAISIDGTEAQHNAMRRGTSLDIIRRQIESFKQVRRGEILIWSTLRPGMSLLDCFDSFMYFRARQEADHFFWHWDESEGMISDVRNYLRSYGRDLHQIMKVYVDHMSRGELLSVVHLNELIMYLLTRKRRGTTACGVEEMANFDIIGDGKVHACADLPQAMVLGHLTEAGDVIMEPDARQRLASLVAYKADLGCDQCGVEPYCGGRCPVQVHTGGIPRARQYCFMMREHVRIVKQYMDSITHAMAEQGISVADLHRSAHVARLTDVTP